MTDRNIAMLSAFIDWNVYNGAGIKAEALRAAERNYGQAPSDSRPGGES